MACHTKFRCNPDVHSLDGEDETKSRHTTQVPDAFIMSEGEESSIKARKEKVRKALKKLNNNIQKNEEPPVIAILGSGGGLRAMVGFLGVLAELAKEDVLDAITYICGTSGSTWCISSLFNDEKWSSCMEKMESQITNHLLSSSWTMKKILEKLYETFFKETFSLTNIWAYAFIHIIINEINEKTLSSHRTSCENGENPYPVYSAVETGSLKSNDPGTWFEFTPHLVGFPAYIAAQRLWGSAPASSTLIRQSIKGKFYRLFYSISTESDNEEVSLLSSIEESLDSDGICLCDGCRKLVEFLSSHDLARMTDTEVEMLWGDSESSLERVNLLKTLLLPIYTQKCFFNWQWGTTNNFLYKRNSNIPDDLYSKEFLSLVDAGLEINSAYPLMLLPNRKVDLILSFDHSEGDPFLTLKDTDTYCKKNGIPFPQINIDDKESEAPSKSCYVFKGDGNGAPDVMHFPLFNNDSCEGEVHKFREKYATFKLFYDESELTELLKISKLSVKKNKDQILDKFKHLKCQ
ncbi:cytosolic phospholipase A2 gamma [Rhinoderma darwinii]|uniref:cytosolic phospholipase A2 gamma n=1 Tax=Rhinoderma darwinii TaxID=43563 RepID=UPI003F66804D